MPSLKDTTWLPGLARSSAARLDATRLRPPAPVAPSAIARPTRASRLPGSRASRTSAWSWGRRRRSPGHGDVRAPVSQTPSGAAARISVKSSCPGHPLPIQTRTRLFHIARVSHMIDLGRVLRYAVERGASDVHLKVPSPPAVRIHGLLQRIPKAPPLKPADTERFIQEMLGPYPDKLREFTEPGGVDF